MFVDRLFLLTMHRHFCRQVRRAWIARVTPTRRTWTPASKVTTMQTIGLKRRRLEHNATLKSWRVWWLFSKRIYQRHPPTQTHTRCFKLIKMLKNKTKTKVQTSNRPIWVSWQNALQDSAETNKLPAVFATVAKRCTAGHCIRLTSDLLWIFFFL